MALSGRGHGAPAPGAPRGVRPPDAAPPNVLLVGFTGAGKSTVGAILARRLGRPHLDVDDVIEARLGPIPAFVAASGVPAFRAAERALLRERLPAGGAVVSAGAGSVRPAATRRLLCRGAVVFFLDVPAPVLAARLAALPPERRHRPDLLEGDAVAAIAAELRTRRPLYERLGLRVDATAPPEAVAGEVLRLLAAPTPGV